jgi:hypothetical protein
MEAGMSLVSIINPRETVLAQLPKRATGMEIGVWKGDFSARILAVTKPKKLHLVDPWKAATDPVYSKALYGPGQVTQADMDRICEAVRGRFSKAAEVEFHRGTLADIAPGIADGSLDFAYVDGDHSYAGVTADLNGVLSKVRSGGLICGDDYALGHWWGDGVVRAVHEFIAANKMMVELLVGTQYMLRRL